MTAYNQWLAYYESHFSNISNMALQGYWEFFGRESEAPFESPREQAAWVAVNQELSDRGLD